MERLLETTSAHPERLYDTHRKRVWGLAYRLTGNVEDADDVVQETFARLIERPPRDTSALDGWLLRVATRLGIDAVRGRRRRAYSGAWLPAPVEADDEDWLECFASNEPDPEARYGLLESVTFAFLVALEALSPKQRAVLLLRDVLGYSTVEAARILGTSDGNVRVVHLRARRAMANYDASRHVPDAESRARHRVALERFLACLAAQDTRALEALLSESVRTTTDAGGAYTALAAPMDGRARIARFYLRATANRVTGGPSVEVRIVNGMPAAVIALARPVRRQAPLTVLFLEFDAADQVRAVHTVLAPSKLARVTKPA
jgi:RNA polymerase sigma-70 factor (ECF subfamily)